MGTEIAVRPGPRNARPPAELSLRARGRLRRRARFLRKQRELQLRDLGGLVFDMYRFASKRQDLVRDKLRQMFAADRELREFEQMLGDRRRSLEIREAGVGGACPRCLTLHSSEAHYCSNCGLAVTASDETGVVVEPAPADDNVEDPFASASGSA